LKEAALRRWLPGWFRRLALGPVARLWPKADWLPRPLRAKTALTNLSLDAGSAYANTLSICRPPLRRQLLAPDLAVQLNGYESEQVVRDHYAAVPAGDPLGGMIAADVALLLPDDFLVKVDRASMAHGLEVRPPLLDHELLELTARLPSEFKVRSGQTKWLLKQTYEKKLPDGAVSRGKRGFEIPVDQWLRGPLRELFEEAVLKPQAPAAGLVNQTVARSLFRSHLARSGRHGDVLWSLLILTCWAERYLTSAAQIPAPGNHAWAGTVGAF
jgi:asparagine synthase (glutamine-hydrolysing)